MDAHSSMNQAPDTIDFYFNKAIKKIDTEFGEGYAKAHPELVAAYIQACVADYKAARMEEVGNELNAALRDISGSIAHM